MFGTINSYPQKIIIHIHILIHKSFEKAKKILERNQYPPSFYEPIFKKTLNTIITKPEDKQEETEEEEEVEKATIFLQYRGCLLYTSPSPRDGLLSRMPSSA